MNKDLLAALRETPGCGEDPECIVRHTLAVHHADECDPCLTRLAEAVIEQVVARLPLVSGATTRAWWLTRCNSATPYCPPSDRS